MSLEGPDQLYDFSRDIRGRSLKEYRNPYLISRSRACSPVKAHHVFHRLISGDLARLPKLQHDWTKRRYIGEDVIFSAGMIP
jgi:hypothetical protein